MKANRLPFWLLSVMVATGCGESAKKPTAHDTRSNTTAGNAENASDVTAATVCTSAGSRCAVLYVDAAGACTGNTPCYTHPQEAVNKASSGDTIWVYPGTYGSRVSNCTTTQCGCRDTNAPALIVYKDNLTLRSVGSATETIIESTHLCWSNAEPVSRSTDGAVSSIAAPNGVSILGRHVVIDGFTLRSEYKGAPAVTNGDEWPNTAGIMIGGLFAGDTTHLGVTGTTVKASFIVGHSGIYNWRASDTILDSNTVRIHRATDLPGIRHNGNGVVVSDGYFNGTFPPTSTGVRILRNDITTTNVDPALGGEGYGVTFGGTEASGAGADQSGMFIEGNTIRAAADGIKFWHSIGANKTVTCNNEISFGVGFHRAFDRGEKSPASTWTDEGASCK